MKKVIKAGIRLGACGVVLACVACSPNSSDDAQLKSAPAESDVSQEVLEVLPSANTGVLWGDQVEAAIADLAGRTGIEADAITVREARSVDWGSSALGCPEEGMSYTDALIPGLRLLLEVDGTVYFYHGENEGSLFLCPTERAKAPAYGPGTEIM